MAADGLDCLDLTIIEGNKSVKILLLLPQCEVGGCLQVRHIQEEIERVTGIKVKRQKLSFKGQYLNSPEYPLCQLGLKCGDKVYLGQRTDESDCCKCLNEIDCRVQHLVCMTAQIVYRADILCKSYSCKNGALCRTQQAYNTSKEIRWQLLEAVQNLESLNSGECCSDAILLDRRNRLICRAKEKICILEGILIGLNDKIIRMTVPIRIHT